MKRKKPTNRKPARRRAKPRVRRKTEDKNDPERRRAKGNTFTFPLREDGEIEGKARVWNFEDRGESLVLCEWHNGELTAFVDKVGE